MLAGIDPLLEKGGDGDAQPVGTKSLTGKPISDPETAAGFANPR
jgi:hypothetical protein